MRAPGDPLLTLLPNPWHLVLFLVGAIAMRGAGCTYNDIVDEDIDAQGRAHPLAAAAVRPGQPRGRPGSSSSLQALVGLAVLLQFNRFTILARHRLAGGRRRSIRS